MKTRAAILFAFVANAALANPVPHPGAAGGAPDASPAVEHSTLAVPVSVRPKARKPLFIPKARWSNKGGQREWTLAMVNALRGHASRLPDTVPRDIAAWCPSYPNASREAREAFWVGLVSSLAWHESTHRPTAVGGGGLWYGLTQILPSTARLYRCNARSGDALKDPRANLACALRIMARTVPRDGVVAAGMRGVAADWGPFHSQRKREDMQAWVRKQDYCKGLSKSLRPVARPADLLPQPSPLDALPPNLLVRPTVRPMPLMVQDADRPRSPFTVELAMNES